MGDNFIGLLAHTAYCPPSLQTIMEKISLIYRHKTVKFKEFYPSKVSRYTVLN